MHTRFGEFRGPAEASIPLIELRLQPLVELLHCFLGTGQLLARVHHTQLHAFADGLTESGGLLLHLRLPVLPLNVG